MTDTPGSTGPESIPDRAQTVIDFAVGAGVLLLTVGVVFAFVPAIFEPFSNAMGSSPIVADRTADHLTGSLLAADPAAPSTLSAACTAAFFDGDNSLAADANCGFTADEPTMDLLGVGNRDVNVTIRQLGDSPTTGPPVEQSIDGTSYRFTRGTTGSQSDVSVASRVVLVGGEQHRLVVKVW